MIKDDSNEARKTKIVWYATGWQGQERSAYDPELDVHFPGHPLRFCPSHPSALTYDYLIFSDLQRDLRCYY